MILFGLETATWWIYRILLTTVQLDISTLAHASCTLSFSDCVLSELVSLSPGDLSVVSVSDLVVKGSSPFTNVSSSLFVPVEEASSLVSVWLLSLPVSVSLVCDSLSWLSPLLVLSLIFWPLLLSSLATAISLKVSLFLLALESEISSLL